MPCKRCGQCCTYIVIKMEKIQVVGDPQGMEKWFENHHLRVYPVPGADGKIAIKIPLTCKFLEYDTDTSTAHCTDYENRPQLCRDYMCPIAKKGMKEEKRS